LAGNDILLMPLDVAKAKGKLIKAFNKEKITEERLAYSVKKVLMAKYKAGLHKNRPVVTKNLYKDLNSPKDDMLYEEAMENAITVVKNDFYMIGIKKLEKKKIAYVKFGDADHQPFLNELNKYTTVTEIQGKDIGELKSKLKDFNLVIIGHHKSNESPWKGYKFSKKELDWLKKIAEERRSNVILTVFSRPYTLLGVSNFKNVDGVVVSYQNSAIAQRKTAQLLFGALPVLVLIRQNWQQLIP